IGDLMLAVVWGRVRLPALATLLKTAACSVALACGVSIGRDGPLIQLSGALAQLVGERLALSSRQAQHLVAASAAAGFATAYNAPFAAVLFVVEVIAGVAVLE